MMGAWRSHVSQTRRDSFAAVYSTPRRRNTSMIALNFSSSYLRLEAKDSSGTFSVMKDSSSTDSVRYR